MKNNIYRSAAQVTVFSVVEKALSFIYRIILSRTIGADGLAIYQICLSAFSVFLTAASSGIPVTVSRLIAENTATGHPAAKHSVVTSGILCTLIFTLPMALVLFLTRNIYASLFPEKECAYIFLWLLPGLILTAVYSVIRGSFWGNKQFLPYSIIELAENAVMVVAGCILIGFTSTAIGGARAAIIAVLISYIFSFLASLGWYFITGGRIARPRGQLKALMASSLPVTAMKTSTSLLNSFVAMFLPAYLVSVCGYSDAEALSIYGAVLGMAVPILLMPNSLIGSIAVVVAPEMSENYYARRDDRLKKDIERTIKASTLIATALIPATFTAGRDLGMALYANELSGIIIKNYSFMMLPMCISMITTTVLNSLHHELRTLIYFFIGAVAMLGCMFIFTPTLGIDAYMIGLTLSFIITAALNLRLLKKSCNAVNYTAYALRSMALCVIACLFGHLLHNLLYHMLGGIWRIMICGGGASLFALFGFYAMEMFTSRPIKKMFRR